MGSSQAKGKGSDPSERVVESLKNKVRVLQGEMSEIMYIRDSENQAYEQELMVFAFKEAEWKRERKKLREEVKSLRKKLENRGGGEEKFKFMDAEKNDKVVQELQLLGTDYLLEHIRNEQARRAEAVEKWKQLYFAVKTELDQLIQRTNEDTERFNRKPEEENLVQELKRELKSRAENIELLQAQLASLEQQETKREREVDILRQSLRIMSHKKARAAIKERSYKKLVHVKNTDPSSVSPRNFLQVPEICNQHFAWSLVTDEHIAAHHVCTKGLQEH